MWGLLLALATFAPAVGQGLGAPSASLLGPAPRSSTEAPIFTSVLPSRLAQPPAGKNNGERLPQDPPFPLVVAPYPVSCVRTLRQHTHTRTHFPTGDGC